MAPQTYSKASQNRPLKLVAVHLGLGSCRDPQGSKQLARIICENVMLEPPDQTAIHLTCCHQQGTTGDTSPSAELAVVKLIEKMENHHSLNCGYGSNLNMNGQVECDASLMCDKTQAWTGVGAISGCKNPIQLAKSLHDHRTISRPLGLIQPNILVGSGAKCFMRDHCPHLITRDSNMISPESLRNYQKFKSRYDAALRGQIDMGQLSERKAANDGRSRHGSSSLKQVQIADHESYCISNPINMASPPNRTAESHQSLMDEHSYSKTTIQKEVPDIDGHESIDFMGKLLIDETSQEDIELRLDTVGAIAVDIDNNFASAVSSGGLLLKYKGRVGQAALPGAGCWAQDSVAATTTGVGEYLTANLFAKLFHDKMNILRSLYDLGHIDERNDSANKNIDSVVRDCFEDLSKSPALSHVAQHERAAGLLAISSIEREHQSDLYLSFGHNTKSMCIGYMDCNDSRGHSFISDHGSSIDCVSPLIETIKISSHSE